MKVSIIIPVFNKAAYVAEAVHSALRQTHNLIEVIAVDDGSTDESAAILDELAARDPRLHVLHQQNGGLSAARNAGLDRATGDYLFFHDADDFLEPDAVENLLAVAEERGSDVVGGVFRRINGSSQQIVTAFQRDDFNIDFAGDAALAELYSTNISVCNKIFRTAALRERGLRFVPGLYMQDMEFWLRLVYSGMRISQTSHVVSNYVAYVDSHSRQRSAKRFASLFDLFDRLEDFYREHDLEAFSSYRNHAFMQGGVIFFARWKLEEWPRGDSISHLDRLCDLLRRIPQQDFETFFARKNASTAATLLAVRERNYALAHGLAHKLRSGGFASLKAQAGPISAADILAFAERRLLEGPPASVRANPRRKAPGGRARSTLRRLINRIKVLLFPYYGRLRDAWRGRTAPPAMHEVSPTSDPTPEARGGGPRVLVFGLGDLYAIGGVQLSYKRLFEYLCARGFSISFYSHRARVAGGTPYYRFPDAVRIEHYELGDSAHAKQRIAEIATREAPDVVLIVNSGQMALALLAALYELPYPIVYSERGGSEHCLVHNWYSRQQREVAYLAADLNHVLMPNYINGVPAWLHEYVHVIPSLTERATCHASPDVPGTDGEYVLLYTGRMSFEKDLRLLIEAFARVAADFPAWRIELYGDGPERAALESLSQARGLAARVLFKGSTSNYEELVGAYARSHLFVLPSRSEGCPLSIREAMAHGLPVIGFSSCSGTNDIVVDGGNGLLAASIDKVEGLEAALRTLMGDAARRRRLGEQGIEDVKQYDPDRIHGLWEALLVRGASFAGHRAALRAKKRAADPSAYDHLHRVLEACIAQGVTRNIAAFSTGVRAGEFEPDVVRAYLLTYGSALFDPAGYARNREAVKLAGVDPLHHYLVGGWRDGMQAGDGEFDQAWYVAQHMAGVPTECPLVHYYRVGRHVGAAPCAEPGKELQARLAAELAREGALDVDLAGVSGPALAEFLLQRLAWRRIDFTSLRELVATQTRRATPQAVVSRVSH